MNMTDDGWNVYELMSGEDDGPKLVYIVPTKDTREHTFENCWCDPEPQIKDGYVILTHNPDDGRE